MAANEIIQVSYKFLAENKTLYCNDIIKTKVYITPFQTIGFHSALFKLQYDIKGKFNVGSEFLESIQIEGIKTWYKNETYEYEIVIEIPDSPISFLGKNLEIIWYLVIELQLDSNTKSELRTHLLKNTKLFDLIKSYDGKIQEKQKIIVSNQNSEYKTLNLIEVNHHMTHIPILFGIFIIAGTALLYSIGTYGLLSYIAIGIGISIFGYGIYKYMSIGLLGKIQLKITHLDKDCFNVTISPEKNYHKITGLEIFYTINEEVIDNRGTSSTTYRELIFQSKRNILNPPFQNLISKEISYPKKDLPTYFKYNSVRLFWQLHIEFKFKNGTSYTLKQEFKVF